MITLATAQGVEHSISQCADAYSAPPEGCKFREFLHKPLSAGAPRGIE
jgi:hypothetical protein